MIPGASRAAIEDALSLASTVSLNIEVPGAEHFRNVCGTKRYLEDVIQPMQWIRDLTTRGAPFEGIKQTTQFVVGAADEVDREIVRYTGAAYERLHLNRVYFSAYQEVVGSDHSDGDPQEVVTRNHSRLTREHRLYQVDYLLRTYGFSKDEIPFDDRGNLDLQTDPKEMWARCHPEFFPVNAQTADKEQLLRVPGLGPVTVRRILEIRKHGGRIRRLSDIGKVGALLNKARPYLRFS